MKQLKSWWKNPNETPKQRATKRKLIAKLSKEIDISEPKDDGIPFFGNEFLQKKTVKKKK